MIVFVFSDIIDKINVSTKKSKFLYLPKEPSFPILSSTNVVTQNNRVVSALEFNHPVNILLLFNITKQNT